MATTHVSRDEIVSILRSRGKLARADWTEHELPDIVDTSKHHSLLTTLEINPADLNPVDPTPQHA